ncbi:GMC family oxidoreductase N-terminal domain-containing protein [Oricola sp.]|uniref:GMC family oxidoreductase n=1 Tax=Oricola sp. TaxID=1979950 RepID=UPI0025E4E2DD|nr:GMC family oxidoreductase N-terminal domain-containing protein [Oricola sp.]MCI5074449.1 GMC family oxidoreductase N-terminal domain-containing protein [Oricola sp.]
MKTLEFDYVVVGAGAAGCVVAARLAEDRAVAVGVIEAGGSDSALIMRIPAANVATGTDPRYNWAYESEPVPALGDRRLYWAQGRVVGGSGSINGMMYMRGHRSDYDRWAANGCTGWSYDDVLPYFRKAETNERGASDLHGGDGPLQVSAGRATAPVCDMFLEAARDTGFALTDDLNNDIPEAFGHVDMTIGNGQRSSTSAAYLRPALKRGNVTVLTQALATRILIENGAAAGIEFIHEGERRRAMAARSVVLCGGAVNSPQLLMLSGIGDAGQLRAFDIPVEADRPEVGRNLQNHPMYKLMYTVTEPVSAYSHVRPAGALSAGLQYALGRKGVLSRGLFPTSGFFHADQGDGETEIQVCMAPAPVVRRKPGVLGILPAEHGFTLLLNHGSPFSRGTVRLKSADPATHAAITPNYFSDPRDIDILARGARRVHEIVQAGPLKRILGRELSPERPTSTQAEIEDDIRRTAVTHYHPVGTCRMGSDDASVVDTQLRVRGVENLRVADASVMPVLVNGNTYAATIMVAEKAADLIRAGH